MPIPGLVVVIAVQDEGEGVTGTTIAAWVSHVVPWIWAAGPAPTGAKRVDEPNVAVNDVPLLIIKRPKALGETVPV